MRMPRFLTVVHQSVFEFNQILLTAAAAE